MLYFNYLILISLDISSNFDYNSPRQAGGASPILRLQREKMVVVNKIERDHWHPAFVGAMGLELVNDKQFLVFDDEHPLSHEPLKMDMLIIKKDESAVINNEIGRIFRRYNIIEYKSPDDALTIDDYAKTVSYAYLYKGLGNYVNEVPFNELTVTMIRDRMPDALFQSVCELGGLRRRKIPWCFLHSWDSQYTDTVHSYEETGQESAFRFASVDQASNRR